MRNKKKNIKRVVNKRHAWHARGKKGEYAKVISEIESKGICPFCPENFIYHKHPILRKYKGWFITKNNWPYKNTKYHFLIISEKHKENFFQITNDDLSAIKILTNWAVKKFNIKGGGLVLRFGDTDFTGATVCHLHFSLIYPEADKKGIGKIVNFPIG